MINCGCHFDCHCDELLMQCGCGACLAYEAFLRLKTWEEQKEAFRGVAARLGKKICPFLSGLDYTPDGTPEVSSAEWNEIVTGNEVTEENEPDWEPTTIAEVLNRISPLDDDHDRLDLASRRCNMPRIHDHCGLRECR